MGTTEWTAEEQREHRKLWVEALRSGKYRQAKGVLNDGKGHMCCLGVACDISGLGKWKAGKPNINEGVPTYLDEAKVLPGRIRDWLGLAGKMGGYGPGDLKRYLTDDNDGGAPFAKIADLIESEPEGLIAERAS